MTVIRAPPRKACVTKNQAELQIMKSRCLANHPKREPLQRLDETFFPFFATKASDTVHALRLNNPDKAK